METPQWLFGPSGDLQPLPYPEPGIGNTVERFGGIHQAINGARTVDTFGFRAGYEFELEYLEPEDYFRLEALFTETIPGPFRLIDPMRKNLVSRESAVSRDENYSGNGLAWKGSNRLSWKQIPESPVSWNKRASEWSKLSEGGFVMIDAEKRIPTLPNEQMAFSVYLKPSVGVTVRLSLEQWSNGAAQGMLDSPETLLTAGVWTRVMHTFTTPAEIDNVIPYIWVNAGPADAETVLIVTPQVEFGPEATAPALGGAVTTVAIESLEATSPRYPYQSVTLSLLEV